MGESKTEKDRGKECVWKEWEDRGRMSEAGEKADHEQKGSQCVHQEGTEFCPYKVIMHVCKKGRGTGCL